MARARAVLRGAFSNAVARRLIDWDPWTAVEPEAGHEPHIVDPDLVMTPDQITELAAAVNVAAHAQDPDSTTGAS